MICNGCSLENDVQSPCLLGVGETSARIMFIQDCPGELDDKRGEQFSGKVCNNLNKLLENRGIVVSKDVYFTSLIKCTAPKEEPKPVHISACSDILTTEIELVDPDIIVPVGKNALKYCVGRNALTKMRGNAQEVELCGRKRIILPMMHPRSTLIKPLYKDFILKDVDTLKDLFEHGMKQVSNVNYKCLEDVESCVAEIVRLKNEAKILSFDIETTGKSPYLDWSKIVCISLSDKVRTGCVIPLYKKDSPIPQKFVGFIVKLLRWLLEDESIPKVAQNGKFDIEWLDVWLGIKVKNFVFDSMLAHYLCISEEQGTQGLKSMAWEFTDMGGYDNELDEYKSHLPDTDDINGRNNYDNIPWDILKVYAMADSDCCLRLCEYFKPMIDENENWVNVLYNIMIPASYTLKDIEKNGMKLDVELSEKYNKVYGEEVKRITGRLESYPEVLEIEREKQRLYLEREKIKLIPKKDRTPEEQKKFEKYKGYENFKFNWNSVNHLRELLFDKLKLVTSVTTDTGLPSTNEDSMNEMREQHEIPDLMLELRKVTTLQGMFIQKLPELKDANDVIHPSFNLTGCITSDSLIPTSEGLKCIGSLISGTQDGEFVEKHLSIVNRYNVLEETSHVVFYQKRSTIRIFTQLGFSIEGTYNHPLLSNKYTKRQTQNNVSTKKSATKDSSRVWKKLEDIQEGDLLAVPYGYNQYGDYILEIPDWKVVCNTNSKQVKIPSKMTAELAELLGMYYADGCIKDSSGSWCIEICNKDEDVKQRVKILSELLFGVTPTVYFDNKTAYSSICSINLAPLEQILLMQRGCLNKTIPQYILDAPKHIQVSYLKGMTLDGCYITEQKKRCFRYSFAREDVAITVQLMLLNLGIVSSRRQDKQSSNTFNVSIYNQEYVKFRDTVGFVQGRKNDRDFVPELHQHRMYFIDEEHKTLWLKVKKIEYGINDVYDFTVPNTHSFISNGFISHNTVTGRLSSENPNAQQLPRKAEDPTLFQYHNEPKSLFVSRYGSNGCIMNADYSALEMRVAGIISKDKNLTQALLSGKDLHKSTASLVWGVPIDEVPKDMRTNAKAVNFGIIYGKSGITFAKDLYFDPSGKNPKKTDDWDKAKKQGLKLVEDYLNTFSGLEKWLEDTKRFAKKHGYVQTMFGRRRRLPDLNSKVPTLKSNAERQSINAPIQGTGSDFTLLSLIQINEWLKATGKKSMIIATVHDSIVFDVYLPELSEVATKVKDIMENVHKPYIDTVIPIIADLELGVNYGATFEVSLDEVSEIHTESEFKVWNNKRKLEKYAKEIEILHSKGWSYEQVIDYFCKNNVDMVSGLVDFMVKVYSND